MMIRGFGGEEPPTRIGKEAGASAFGLTSDKMMGSAAGAR